MIGISGLGKTNSAERLPRPSNLGAGRNLQRSKANTGAEGFRPTAVWRMEVQSPPCFQMERNRRRHM